MYVLARHPLMHIVDNIQLEGFSSEFAYIFFSALGGVRDIGCPLNGVSAERCVR